ncbi:hypothetical protein SAMN05216350_101726 [Polaromonas sp. YR568]|uniref:hypothetical protein n=1 Tax=Polaromonas sp. YR568 TaxID=1855301 RepID=UPI0008E4EBE5|nr:hypothetical protein [Polaromonas sp. YR568]SFU39490.1 hypothetical protein SAMN05216350_101726 [Polaromonas sp. YR568]
MKKLIASLFGVRATAAVAQRAPASSRDNPLTIEDGSDNATRRQLVQVLLRDAVRKYGIPPRWIDCQMMVVSSRSRGPGMYVRLVVRQWDDRLLNYAHAFQTALMVEITRFEPQASQWLHGISWQLEVADSCPYRTMPDKSFWADPARPAPEAPQRSHMAAPAATASASAARQAALAPAPMSAATAAAAAAPIIAALSQSQAQQPAPAPSASRAAATADSDAMKDLESLFKIRDQELSKGGDGGPAVGYESTQPSPL